MGLLARGRFAKALLIGGAGVAITQFLPILQIGAGIIALILGNASGLVVGGDDETIYRITNVAGGFVVATVAGGLLLSASVVLGLFLQLITPSAWWGLQRVRVVIDE